MAQNMDLAQNLYYNYDMYKEKSLTKKRIKHEDITPVINDVKRRGIFRVEKAGQSAQGRDIYLLSIGHGKSNVFLWSQMHGDEATATMALFDILNFFHANDGLDAIKKQIFDSLTIYFMPMVNPDGAEVYQRRTSYEIDVNRDFNRQQTPEAVLLRKAFDKIKAEFGFNLHDQATRYSVGNSPKSAAIAFLAPSIDHDKSVDSVRDNSMKLIGELYKMLNHFIPGHIAKYKDDYEPRAFGDNFQKSGTSTILLESGLWKDDSENQYVRKLNFLTLVSAFYSIATKSYKAESTKTYDNIPPNVERLFDLLIRNLTYNKDGKNILVDIGINRNEIDYNSAKDYYYSSSVEEIGDLSVFYGLEDFDFSGYELLQGKTFAKVFNSLNEIKKHDFNKLYEKGFTSVLLNSKENLKSFTTLPINILQNNHKITQSEKLLNRRANYVITKNGEVHFTVINGFLIGVKSQYGRVINGLVDKTFD
jgi:hypothetical protein